MKPPIIKLAVLASFIHQGMMAQTPAAPASFDPRVTSRL